MNREIKFRGWNGRRWTREYTLNEMLCEHLENNGLKEKWVQYTGLKDNNGKEIYEGDIARQFFTEDEKVMKCVWKKTGYVWEGEDDGVSGNWSGQDFEIIGNIYENPELLTNKD